MDGIEELRLQQMALIAKQHISLWKECGMLGSNIEGEVHLTKEGFKKLFPKWEIEERADEYAYLLAEAYGVKFFCLVKKEEI